MGRGNCFKGRQFTAEVILWAVRWYLMFPVSYHGLELLLFDRGVEVDHTEIFRWLQAYAGELEKRIPPASADVQRLLARGRDAGCQRPINPASVGPEFQELVLGQTEVAEAGLTRRRYMPRRRTTAVLRRNSQAIP